MLTKILNISSPTPAVPALLADDELRKEVERLRAENEVLEEALGFSG